MFKGFYHFGVGMAGTRQRSGSEPSPRRGVQHEKRPPAHQSKGLATFNFP